MKHGLQRLEASLSEPGNILFSQLPTVKRVVAGRLSTPCIPLGLRGFCAEWPSSSPHLSTIGWTMGGRLSSQHASSLGYSPWWEHTSAYRQQRPTVKRVTVTGETVSGSSLTVRSVTLWSSAVSLSHTGYRVH